jgi:hypothetical protein
MNELTKKKLREDTNKWIELDDLVIKLKKKIKEIERNKSMLSDRIVEVMDEFDIADLNISEHQIKYRVTNQKQGMSKKFLLENLTMFYNGNLDKAINTLDFLDSKRSQKSQIKLLQTQKKNLIKEK